MQTHLFCLKLSASSIKEPFLMDDLLQHLEVKIQALIQRCQLLENANLHLKQNKSLLMREKELLVAKNKAAINQIETMVSRLKSIEGAL